METGKEFTRLLNNLLRENQQYDTELKNFLFKAEGSIK